MHLKLPKIIGHRGCAGYAPENTLEAIHTAADMGVEWVELDVKLTKDEVPIIFHDHALERTTNGTGLVAETDYKTIKQFEAGSWYGESFAGAKVPTLEETIDVLIERDLGVNIEIKPCPGREKLTAEIALDMLSQYWDEHNKILISSFTLESLEVAQDMAEDWARGYLLGEEWPEDWQNHIDALQPTTIHVNGRTIEESDIKELSLLGKPILAYTINDDPELTRNLQSCGVYGFFSDTPDIIRENLLMVH